MNLIKVNAVGVTLGEHAGGYSELLERISNKRSVSKEDRSLASFKADKELGDRRLMKAISQGDAIGLIALNRSCSEALTSAAPNRRAIYVGAQCPSARDHAGYMRAVEASNNSEAAFGENISLAHPMTLLTSLANNVLCYGAIRLEARGTNSNYTNMETSGQIAVINALRALQNGEADCALAGGYSFLSEDRPFIRMYEAQGFIQEDSAADFAPFEGSSTLVCDGSVFLNLSPAAREGADAVYLIDGDFASDLSGPFGDANHEIAYSLVMRVLRKSNISLSHVSQIWLSGNGAPKTDIAETKIAEKIRSINGEIRFFSASRFTGNLVEAGGLVDIALARHVATNFDAQKALQTNHNTNASPLTP